MNADGSGKGPRYQLEETRSTLADLQERVQEAVNRDAEALRERVRAAASARDSLDECQGFVDMAGHYAAVAEDLLSLGETAAAEVAVSLGLAYVDAAEHCLDELG